MKALGTLTQWEAFDNGVGDAKELFGSMRQQGEQSVEATGAVPTGMAESR